MIGNLNYIKSFVGALILNLLTITGKTQAVFFNDMDFSSGNWELFITINEGPEEELEQLDNLYTSDVSLIQNIITHLNSEQDTMHMAVSHYSQKVSILRNREVQGVFYLRTSLGLAMKDDVIVDVGRRSLQKLFRKLDKLSKESVSLSDMDSARRLANSLDTTYGAFIETKNDPAWRRYEGKLIFQTRFSPPLAVNVHSNSNYGTFFSNEVFIDSLNNENWLEKLQKYKPNYQTYEQYGVRYRDSIDNLRETVVEQQISESMGIDTSSFHIKYYCISWPSGDGFVESVNYILYSNSEPASHFNAYPIIDGYKPFTEFKLVIYRKD